ncbi:MAG TPA: CHC2 zinc finger domain-containing protein [Terriglobales bacterium]|jgi:DNA primase|nr:CHC2 zinc finger domain-containing protein [Terriglobales bacterium]
MTSSDNFKETLKQQADIVRIVGDYVKLKKAGAQNFSGLCPFHAEKTPSFSVHATRQFFHCFGCGQSGDVFTFVQKVENITFPEAVRLIAQKLGVPMPKVSFSSPAEARDAQLRMALLDVHVRATEFFQECLRRPEGANARQYLKGRGLDDETIARFRIGYGPDSGFVLKDALRREFDEELLRESGLFSWKEDSRQSSGLSTTREQLQIPRSARDDNSNSNESSDPSGELPAARSERSQSAAIYSKFRNRVMFPICNDQGKVIAFTGRTLSTDEKAGPKYLNSPETPIYSKSRVLFNLDNAKEAIRKLDYSILVEGQMDCISVYAAGFHNVIASSGTAFTELHAKLLGRFSKKIVVNFDPDAAGIRATSRVESLLEVTRGNVTSELGNRITENTFGKLIQEEFDVRVVTLEPGFDPDLFIRRKGKGAYAAALKNSQRILDYLIDQTRAQFGGARTAENKVKALNHLLPHIQRVPNRIVRDELALEISQKLGIDSAVLRQELKHAATNRSAIQVKTAAETQITAAERVLIRALASATQIQAAETRSSARDGTDEEFDPARQAQYALQSERLYEGLGSQALIEALLGPGAETADVMTLPKTEEDRRLLASILMHEEEELTPEMVEGAVRALRRIYLRRRLEEVQLALQRSALPVEERQALLHEKVRFKRALMDPGLAEAASEAS